MNTLYSIWVTPKDLAEQIRKLQRTEAFINGVTIVKSKSGVVQYEVSYTDITNPN
jgi:hypothetical protein